MKIGDFVMGNDGITGTVNEIDVDNDRVELAQWGELTWYRNADVAPIPRKDWPK